MPESQNAFVSKLQQVTQARPSKMILLLSPRLDQMPLPIQRYDEPLLPFGKAIIDATYDLVCGYAFDLEAYLVPGAAGIIALERTINYVPDGLMTILHGSFFTPAAFGIMLKTGLNVDAITVGNSTLIEQQPSELRSRLLLIDNNPEQPHSSHFSIEKGTITISMETEMALQMRLVDYQSLLSSQGLDFAQSVRNALTTLATES